MCHTAGWDGYPDRRLQTVWFYRTEPCLELQHCWRHLSDAWSSVWETPACLRLLCPRGPSCKNIIEHYSSQTSHAPEFYKVYLVTGGRNRTTSRMSSTEILVAGSTFWVESSPLPSPRVGLRGVNIGGDFYVIGGEYIQSMVLWLVFCQCLLIQDTSCVYAGWESSGFFDPKSKDILQYQVEEGVWKKTAELQTGRYEHALSIISMEDIKDFCEWSLR